MTDAEKKLFAIEKNEAPANIAVGMLVTISDEGELSVENKKTTKRVW